MTTKNTRRRAVTRTLAVVAVVILLIGVSLEVITTDMKPATPPPVTVSTSSSSLASESTSSTTSEATTSSSISTTRTTSATSSTGSIEITSPAYSLSVAVGDIYNISGIVSPKPTLPDYVLIQVYQKGGTGDLDAETATVLPNGYFQYNATVGSTWTTGYYVITATDSYGATGNVTIYVGCDY